MPSKISASVVSYNNREQLMRLLQSFERYCDVATVDLYLIDNASVDGTIAAVRQSFPWVKLIVNERNLGFGEAHNQVLDQLDSEYHLVINPDIVFIEDTVTSLADFMDSHPQVVMATPRILNLDGSEQRLPKSRPRLKYVIARRYEQRFGWAKQLCREYTRADESLDQPTHIENCTGSFFIIRTKIFKQLGGFDSSFFLYFEDNDLTVRAMQLGSVMFVPITQVLHGYERAAMRDLSAFITQARSMLRFFSKHGW
ncbi:MAG: glycosyltransferase family 2 protein [Coriobacteriaceae bacterium]|nr:glycosyltransferase family 2 protein [Coriobacteriaceae bacterium]